MGIDGTKIKRVSKLVIENLKMQGVWETARGESKRQARIPRKEGGKAQG